MTPPTLNISLENKTTSNTVYAYITGRALDGDGLVLLQADGHTPYFPPSPAQNGSHLGVDCAIRLGGPGSTTTVTIPRIYSGRIWISVDNPLVFLINIGPALVEPAVANPSDPNINTNWGFCEFTFNRDQLFANISYVDFVSLPISLALTTSSGERKEVEGIPADGLDTVCSKLKAQNAIDGQGWDKLIVTSGGKNLRALSPNIGLVGNSALFSRYFDSYVNQVWAQYADGNNTLTIDTQAQWGIVGGRVVNDQLTFPGLASFSRPSTRDIFTCSTGPFAVTSIGQGNLAARISAAFNRSSLLKDGSHEPAPISAYYLEPVTNHYSRILHEVNEDGRGYAFPYDDVTPGGSAVDQSGSVFDANPTGLSIAIGGGSASGPGGDTGPSQGLSAFVQIPAAGFTSSQGVQTEPCTDVGGGRDVGWIANGDWMGYANVDFGSQGATQFKARVASGAGPGISGLVKVALDSPTAAAVGSFSIGSTGGWQVWRTVPANISRVTGVHTVYLAFESGQPADFVNVNWFIFS